MLLSIEAPLFLPSNNKHSDNSSKYSSYIPGIQRLSRKRVE
jgi:hypothetical protein